MVRIGRVLTFSNVVACLALFVALGGSVYAAGKINGKQIKAGSIPGNRVKAKSLTGKQIKPRSLTGTQMRDGSLTGTQIKGGSLTGTQIKAGSLTGTQIQAGSLTGTQINQSTLTGVSASALAKVQYVAVTVALGASPAIGLASCPVGTNVIGGGALVSDEVNAFVNDSSPNGARSGWTATGFGELGTRMTITAICTPVSSISG